MASQSEERYLNGDARPYSSQALRQRVKRHVWCVQTVTDHVTSPRKAIRSVCVCVACLHLQTTKIYLENYCQKFSKNSAATFFFVSRHRSDRRDLVYSRFPVYNLACVGNDRNRAKTAEPIEIPLGKSELELCIRWRVLWRHLENTMDRSVRLRR